MVTSASVFMWSSTWTVTADLHVGWRTPSGETQSVALRLCPEGNLLWLHLITFTANYSRKSSCDKYCLSSMSFCRFESTAAQHHNERQRRDAAAVGVRPQQPGGKTCRLLALNWIFGSWTEARGADRLSGRKIWDQMVKLAELQTVKAVSF